MRRVLRSEAFPAMAEKVEGQLAPWGSTLLPGNQRAQHAEIFLISAQIASVLPVSDFPFLGDFSNFMLHFGNFLLYL